MHPTNFLCKSLLLPTLLLLSVLLLPEANSQSLVLYTEDFNSVSPAWNTGLSGSDLIPNSFPSTDANSPNRWIIGAVPAAYQSVDGTKALYVSCNNAECGDARPEFKSIPDELYASNVAAAMANRIPSSVLGQGGNLFLEFNWIFPKQGEPENTAGAKLIYSIPGNNNQPVVWREVNQPLLKAGASTPFSIKLGAANFPGYDSTRGLFIGFRWFNAAPSASDNSIIIDNIRVVLKPTFNLLSVSPQSPVPVCSGSQIVVNTDIAGFPAGTTWNAQLSTPAGDFSSPYNLGPVTDGANILVIPADRISSTTYKIRLTSSGNLNSNDVDINITKLPNKPVAGGDLSLCSAPEDPVSIGSLSSTEPDVSYSWNIPNLNGLTNTFHEFPAGDANLVNTGLSPQNKLFIVTATANGNSSCQSFDTVLVRIFPKPQISTVSVPEFTGGYPICENEGSYQLSATVLPATVPAPGTSTGVWSGAGIISGPSNTRFFNPGGLSAQSPVTLIYTHSIKWTATGPTCKTEKEVIFKVKSIPDADAGPTAKACQNEPPVQLTANSPGPNWFGNGVTTGGLFNPSSVIIPPSSASRTVSCSLWVSVNGCKDTAVKFITVFKPPVVNAGSDDTICQSTPNLLLLGYSPLPGAGPSTGVWTGAGINGGGSASPSFKPGVGTGQVNVLTYTFTDENSCNNSDSKVVYVLPDPVATAGLDQGVCSGESIVVGGSSIPNYTYQWYSPPAAFFSQTNASLTTITLTNNFGVTAQTVKARLRVKDTITGCTSIDSVLITVKPLPQATLFLPTDTTACEGAFIRLKANLASLPANTPFKFQWYRDGFPLTLVNDSSGFNAGLTGKYQVAMSIGDFGCFDTSSAVSLRFYPNIKPRIVGDTNFCGSSSTLLRAVPANANFAYEWKLILPPDSSFSPPKIDTILLPGTPVAGVNVGKKGKLFLNMQTDKGCKSRSEPVQVSQLAQPIVVTDRRNAVFCDNDGFRFSTLDSSAFKYRWLDSANRNVIIGEKSTFEPKVAGTYYLEVYNKCGIAADTFRVFQIRASPKFGILQNGKRDTTVCLNQEFEMQGPSGYLLYRWFVPKLVKDTATGLTIISADTLSRNLTCDSGLNVNTEQSYRLTLLIRDQYNCQNQDSVRIFVAQCPAQLFIPNAFIPILNPQSPEELASKNKLWFFDGYGIASVKWYIYNRWGEMVASGNQYGEPQNPSDGRGWDGTFQKSGLPCPTGTYKYLIEYTGEKDNVTKKLAGNLTLIR